MKTRYAHDYLCLPSLLQRQGYRTEMVIGQHRDLNRLQSFVARNGLQQLIDEGDFPKDAERMGLGIVDGLVPEPPRGAHDDHAYAAELLEGLVASDRPCIVTPFAPLNDLLGGGLDEARVCGAVVLALGRTDGEDDDIGAGDGVGR